MELSAPLILGCDLRKLDPFTLSLITNDEVLDIDQDSLVKQATCVSKNGDLEVYAKPLDDGTWPVGLINRGEASADVALNLEDLKLTGKQVVRDLWRQKDSGTFDQKFSSAVAPHGVVLLRITPGISEAYFSPFGSALADCSATSIFFSRSTCKGVCTIR